MAFLFKILTTSFGGDHLESILSHLSQAVIDVAFYSHPRHWLLSDIFASLTKWTSPPAHLTQHAYQWCSAICEKNEDLSVCGDLLTLALRLGFRRADVRVDWMRYPLVHTTYHGRMIDIVFSTKDPDVIADALCAWTLSDILQLHFPSLGACVDRFADLADMEIPPRLRRMVIRSIESLGHPEFDGIAGLVPLLNRLEVEAHEIEWGSRWTRFLLSVFRSSLGRQCLSSHYWQRIVPMSMRPGLFDLCLLPSDLEAMRSFEELGDWEKLEVWIGLMWILELPEGGINVEEVGQVTRTLFRNRPSALRTVHEWALGASEDVDSLYSRHGDTFRTVCDQAREEIERERSLWKLESG